jgi:cell division protease FtsH
MVTAWGLSSLGPLTFGEEEGEVFLGRRVSQNKEISDETARLIDEEVHQIIKRNYDRAKKILVAHKKQLNMMADALVKYETIDANQLKEIMDGKAPTPPTDWEALRDDEPQPVTAPLQAGIISPDE